MIRPNLFTLLPPTSLLLTEAVQQGCKRMLLSHLSSSVSRLALLLLPSGLQVPWEWLKLVSLPAQNWTGPQCKLLYDCSLQADLLGSFFLGTFQCFNRWEKIWVENISPQVEMPFCDTDKIKRMVLPTWTLAKLLLRVWIALSEESGFCTSFFNRNHYPCDF